jgi:hypothetical protein
MDKMILTKTRTLTLLLGYSLGSFAINPIDAKLIQGFPSTVSTNGSTYAALYSFTSNIPFTMVTPFDILKTSVPASDFSFSDQCSGQFLTYHQSCTVNIYLRPRSSGTKSVTLTEAYGNERVPVASLSTNAAGNGGGGNNSAYVTGNTVTPLPAKSQIDISQPWKFEFKNNGTKDATTLNVNVTGASIANNTCVSSLGTTSSTNTCYVEGSYTPTTTAPHSVMAILSYAEGTSVELVTSTNTNMNSAILSCSTQIGFAPQTLKDSSVNNITLLCTNNSNESITIDSHTATYPNSSEEGIFSVYNPPAGNNCIGSLDPKAACQLKGNYTAPSNPINTITVALSVNYHTSSTSGLSASTSTSTDIVATINNSRTLKIVNQCPFDVWWGMASGAAKHLGSCTSNADCAGGDAVCNTSNNTCYYKTEWAPTGGTEGNPYHLPATSGQAEVTISQNNASGGSGNILWSGLISASTKCNGETCENNPCGNNGGTTSCQAGVGFDQPATEAEFALLLQGQGNVDSYDISNVNGFSLPISMRSNQTANEFTCGNAGNPSAVDTLGACNYSNVSPPSYIYYWVSQTGTACSTQNTCSIPGQICGLYKSGANFIKNCGEFRGYWSANEICQTNPNFSLDLGNGVTCSQVLGGAFPPPNGTITDLLKCSPPDSSAYLYNSCYLSLSGNGAQCCGCTNWPNTAATSQCTSTATDSQWTNYILNLIKWQKQACATSYSYPYDDPSSSFKCSAGPDTQYTITFCPGDVTGLPGNIPSTDDGRA